MPFDRARARSVHGVLAMAIAVGVAASAACGGGNASYGGPGAQPPATATFVAPSSSASSIASAPTPPASGSVTVTPPPLPGGKVMNTPRATALAGELAKIGLDVRRLPKLGELPPKQLRDVMELFKTSLGVRCTDCHLDDYAAPTRRKKIAEHMWDDFVGKLTIQDGSPIFCDSCHQGQTKQLERKDKPGLRTAMLENFVNKLKRTDGLENTCTTCHVSDVDYAILDKWAAAR